MNHRLLAPGLLGLGVALFAGCGGGNSLVPPSVSPTPGSDATLQFAVGTTTYYSGTGSNAVGAVGLNTVETLRQANGLSAVLLDVPVVTGPSGFVVPTGFTGSTGSASTDAGGTRLTQASFGSSTGAFGYGFCACDSLSLAGANGTSSSSGVSLTGATPSLFVPIAQPIGANPTATFVGGAPAFPSVLTPAYDAAFPGYSLGFLSFAVTPVTGAYRLDVGLPPTFVTTTGAAGTLTKTAQLRNAAGLPPYPTPSFAPDGTGGGSVSIVPPAGVTETLVQVAVTSTCLGYSTASPSPTGTAAPTAATIQYTLVAHGATAQTIQIADNLGPVVNGAATPTFCGQAPTYAINTIGADYPLLEAAYPANRTVAPAIVGANGQADLTISQPLQGTYQ